MNQVNISIGASPSLYWAKLETEQHGQNHEKLIQKDRKATENSNVLQAAIDALKALNRPCMLDFYTESDYLAETVKNGWLASWQKNGWKTAKGKDVKNREQWKELAALMAPHSVRFFKAGGK